jgi:hypothetical protein
MADPNAATPPPAQRTLHLAIAGKLLHAWAQNRQQVLVPLTLNLARMDAAQRALVLAVARAALASRGAPPAEDAARLEAALPRIGGSAGDAGPPEPPGLFALVASVQAAGLGAHAYAAAATVLDRRQPVERAFLDWLAARLSLPPNLIAGLARRYRR